MKDKKQTILLADDDEDDRMFFSMAVQEISMELKLLTFVDGDELMQYLNGEPDEPQMIFLDINMPKKSGLECLEEIRNSSRWKDVPVAMYTTSGSEQEITRAKQLGAQFYIIKPFEISVMAEIIGWTLETDWKNTVLPHNEFYAREATWTGRAKL